MQLKHENKTGLLGKEGDKNASLVCLTGTKYAWKC